MNIKKILNDIIEENNESQYIVDDFSLKLEAIKNYNFGENYFDFVKNKLGLIISSCEKISQMSELFQNKTENPLILCYKAFFRNNSDIELLTYLDYFLEEFELIKISYTPEVKFTPLQSPETLATEIRNAYFDELVNLEIIDDYNNDLDMPLNR